MQRHLRPLSSLAVLVTSLLAGAAGLAGAQPAAPAAMEDVRIGYVDLQRAIFSSNAGKEARRALDERTDKLKKDFERKQEDLKAAQAEFVKQSAVLSADARTEKERELQRRLRELERLKQDSEDELNRRDAELSKRILGEVREVVKQIGGKGNYTLILERNAAGVLYAASGVDLTEEVIKAYNAQKPGK